MQVITGFVSAIRGHGCTSAANGSDGCRPVTGTPPEVGHTDVPNLGYFFAAAALGLLKTRVFLLTGSRWFPIIPHLFPQSQLRARQNFCWTACLVWEKVTQSFARRPYRRALKR